jgi:hypothetical protein
MTATIHALIPVAKLRCEGCGTLADAACGCGLPYVPASKRAEDAIAANPQKSNRAIADEVGVSEPTVRRARKPTASHDAVAKRVGKDGKARKVPAAKVETFTTSEFDEEDGITAAVADARQSVTSDLRIVRGRSDD